jgi:hypothetical protein
MGWKKQRTNLRLMPRLCSSLTSCRELTMITSPCSMADASLGISTWMIRFVASLTSLSSSGVDALLTCDRMSVCKHNML